MKQLAREVWECSVGNEVGDHLCNVRVCVILLDCDVTSTNLQEEVDVRMENFITVPNTCQISINDLQLGSVMYGDASPYHHASTAERRT